MLEFLKHFDMSEGKEAVEWRGEVESKRKGGKTLALGAGLREDSDLNCRFLSAALYLHYLYQLTSIR